MRTLLKGLTVWSLLLASAAAAEDAFDAQVAAGAKELAPALQDGEERMAAGDFTGSNERVLAAFPEATRTAAQAFVLGNVLFEVAPKLSYPLHRAAAEAESTRPTVLLEWALEQHRAGAYEAALKTYHRVSEGWPAYDLVHGLEADCLLRLGRVTEAVAAWQKGGRLKRVEGLICAVHRQPEPLQQRAELLAKATRLRDAAAAGELIALDCAFPRDWWDSAPHARYLANDLAVLKEVFTRPEESLLLRSLQAAAECASLPERKAAGVREILTRYELLIDPAVTLPEQPALLFVVLEAALVSDSLNEAVLRENIAPRVRQLAVQTKDTRLWRIVGNLAWKTSPEESLRTDREAWQSTGDARFAAGVLSNKAEAGKLTGDDSDQQAARRQFPEDSRVLQVAYLTAVREKKVTRELLAAAARAEFTRLSSSYYPAESSDRRAGQLHEYFARLSALPAEPK